MDELTIQTEDEEIEYLWSMAVSKSPRWQQHNCPIVKTDKGDVRRAWKQAKKRVDLKTIKLAIEAQTRFRHDSRLAGDHVPQPKMLGAWLRAERWDDLIESHAALKEKIDQQTCSYKNCTEQVMGKRFDVCIDHYADKHCDFSQNIDYLKSKGLFKLKSETEKNWRDRCRIHLEQSGFFPWRNNEN